MIKYIDDSNPIQRIKPELQVRILRAQSNLLEDEFVSAGDLCERVFDDLRISFTVPDGLFSNPISYLTEQNFAQLNGFFERLLLEAGFPQHIALLHAVNLAQRLQLLQAFDDPDEVIKRIELRVENVVQKFPQSAYAIERGSNPGDVLDPYILAATQYLVCGGSFDKAIEATIAHKALMMVEGLVGHLHEDVVGEMRGNVRVPEPRGGDQETLDPEINPFPGADVLQPHIS